MDEILEQIKSAGLKLTQPRKELVRILAQSTRPMSAEEIMDESESGMFDLVTIYRNLTTLCSIHLARGIQLENGKQIYELCINKPSHHHHIVCRVCHNVVCLEHCLGGELEAYARDKGFTDLTHTIEVYGVCEQCTKKSNATPG